MTAEIGVFGKALLLVLLHLAVLAGLAAVILGWGGNFVLLGLAVVVAWAGDFQHLGGVALLVLLGLVILGEIVEAVLGALMARRFGASRWGMIGALVGGWIGAIAGTAWIPLLGSLLGAVAGSFLGAVAAERWRGMASRDSLRAGAGALLGRAAAAFVKLGLGLVIAVFTLRAAYALW